MRNPELHLCFPCGCLGIQVLDHHLLPPMVCLNGKLDWRWSSQGYNQAKIGLGYKYPKHNSIPCPAVSTSVATIHILKSTNYIRFLQQNDHFIIYFHRLYEITSLASQNKSSYFHSIQHFFHLL